MQLLGYASCHPLSSNKQSASQWLETTLKACSNSTPVYIHSPVHHLVFLISPLELLTLSPTQPSRTAWPLCAGHQRSLDPVTAVP
eukprot:1160079-Pelagomonas_calceolata.AAC.9